MSSNNKTWLRLLFLVSSVLSRWYLVVFQDSRGLWFILAAISTYGSIILFLLTYLPAISKLKLFSIKLPRVFGWAAALTLVLLASFLPFITTYQIFLHISGRLLFLLWMAGIGAAIVTLTCSRLSFGKILLLLLLLGGVFYKIGSFIPEIQSVPFALGWSEGSRYYNASNFFARRIYGINTPLPVLHPSRYLLQSLPFLLNTQNILYHRLWQVLLWVVLTGLGSYALARRLKFGWRIEQFMLILWLFLFFFQGAVYYHLMVCAVLILFGYHSHKPLRTLLFVVIASLWAGISRINWFPLPALLAVSIYLMETPMGSIKLFKYLRNPILWSISGAVAALLSNRVYIGLSGNDPSLYSSSFTSGLLWSRLLPNSTFPMGILIALLVVCLPLAALVLQKMIKIGFRNYFQWLRSLGLFLILFVFLAGGIVVSVKIGGGGDLHNVDAFLVVWVVIALTIIFDGYALESQSTSMAFKCNAVLVLLAVLVPIAFSLEKSADWKFIPASEQEADVALLQKAVDVVNQENSEILFISERQLLTFESIKNVNLYHEYEKVFLMEMTMSNNQNYLQEFYTLLSEHKFAAIITDSLSTNIQDPTYSFWAENNEWVNRVVLPILEAYEPLISLENGTINLLIPRNEPLLYQKLIELTPQN